MNRYKYIDPHPLIEPGQIWRAFKPKRHSLRVIGKVSQNFWDTMRIGKHGYTKTVHMHWNYLIKYYEQI